MRLDSRGFSLVELLIAITILVIVAAISLPAVSAWMKNAGYREATQVFLQALRQGRSASVHSNLETRTVFDIPNRRFRITQGNRSANSSNFDTVITDWQNFPAGVVVRNDLPCDATDLVNFGFNPNGSSNQGTICVMTNEPTPQVKFRVRINTPATGRAFIDTP